MKADSDHCGIIFTIITMCFCFYEVESYSKGREREKRIKPNKLTEELNVV
jgi:hypothetical protein